MSYKNQLSLDGSWKLCLIDNAELSTVPTRPAELINTIDARVPGDWPLDYVAAGLLDEPYYQDNYLKIRDYENHHVFYARTFTWNGTTEETYLRFEGIDTVADVYLNGVLIGHAENMYLPHEFAAIGLRAGENELLVHIKPVLVEARKYPIGAFDTTLAYNYPALVIRKATHMFGWDICPRIVSSGLWRGVSVVQKKAERIERFYLHITRLHEDGRATLQGIYDVDIGAANVKPYAIRVEAVCGEHRFERQVNLWYIHGAFRFDVEGLKLWWPRGYGEANLYDVTVTLLKDGQAIDTFTFRQGLRTAELHRTDLLDADGNGDFCFVINGKRIYVKGTNWVPADAFHSNDENRIPAIIDLVTDVGCNAMRVWGGGVYESDTFYDLCDEKGILIWQDFMMACGIYPHTDRMKTQLTEEATAIVRRLRHHACICLWAGDNECDQSYCWGDLKQDPSRNVLTREILPAVLHAEDITRPYLPCSPYVSHQAFVEGREQDTPEQHLWGPRDYFKGHFYHDATALFASEMGYHGCNSPESIYKFIGKEASWPVDDNPMYLYHAASPEADKTACYCYRIPLMSGQLRFLFGVEPQNLDEYARMSQISQAEAKKFFVESFRSRRNRRTGLIWWNIMDCWPQISDAVVDYYFCKKLAYSFIKRSQAETCLMLDDHTGELVLYGVNDRLEDVEISYRLFNVETDETIETGKTRLSAEKSTALTTLRDDDNQHFYGITWTLADGTTGRNHYLQGKPPFDYGWYMTQLKKLDFDTFEGF